MNSRELIIDVAQGNPGALRVCIDTIRSGREDVIEKCQELGIKGSRIWLAFKDLGDETIPKFIENVEAEDILNRLTSLGY